MAACIENMNKYVDFIKCGEILKSPLDNYQLNFILRCYECGKIYFVLETFHKHIQEHCRKNISLGTEAGDTVNHDEEIDQVENLTIKLEENDEMETVCN